ncbi:MAG: hypothetical protein ACE366_25060 [Bradymonadia bacterium]
MSLRMLFTLMGVVSGLMVGAVIYTKVINPPKTGRSNIAQRRAVDRLCYTQCNQKAKVHAKEASDEYQLEGMARICMSECIQAALEEADRFKRER